MSLRLYNAAPHAEHGAEALIHRIVALKLQPERIDADAAPDATRKRKARPRAHWGLPSDSSERLSLIALSRVVRETDLQALNQIATSPVAVSLFASLRPVVQRVAAAVGVADLNDVSIATLFNLSGSSFVSQMRYDGSSLTLPTKLPYQNAKALVRSVLDSLTAALLDPEGTIVPRLLIRIPSAPLDAEAQDAIDVLMARVEADLTERLVSGGRGGSSSSGSSIRPPPPPPLPLPAASSSPASSAFSIDASSSLARNALRAVQLRLGRSLTAAENAAMMGAMTEALSILAAGSESSRQAQLNANLLDALTVASSAQLWASVLEAIQTAGRDGAFEVAKVSAALTEAVSAAVSAQLASLIGL